MNELFANPAVQAAIAPFVVALIVAGLFRRFGLVAAGFAVIAGLLTTVMLTTGLSLQPLTSTRKIMVVGLCLPFVALLMEVIRERLPVTSERWQTIFVVAVPVILLLAAVNWVIWPVFVRQEMSEAWLMLVTVNLYVGVLGVILLTIGCSRQLEKSTAQGTSIFALGLGTAVTSMIAASALYAQLAASVTAAVGALLLVSLFAKRGHADVGRLGFFALFAAAASLLLIGAAATVYAQLPAWVLLCLVTIPLFAIWPTIAVERPWLRLTFGSLRALVPVLPAIWLAWRITESTGY